MYFVLKPGQAMPVDNLHPVIVTTQSDGGRRRYCLSVSGHELRAFPSLLENLDLLYKLYWVFRMKYTPAVSLVFQFLEYAVFKQRIAGRRVPSCVVELATVLQNVVDGQ